MNNLDRCGGKDSKMSREPRIQRTLQRNVKNNVETQKHYLESNEVSCSRHELCTIPRELLQEKINIKNDESNHLHDSRFLSHVLLIEAF
jgi:hypothetical protein